MEAIDKIKALGRSVIVKEIVNELVVGEYNFENKEDKNDKFAKGEILSITSMVTKDENGNAEVKKGDVVMYERHKSTPIVLNGDVYSVFYISDLVCVV